MLQRSKTLLRLQGHVEAEAAVWLPQDGGQAAGQLASTRPAGTSSRP